LAYFKIFQRGNFVFHRAFFGREIVPARRRAMGERANDAWEKAAACERHAQAASDSRLKEMFVKLRQSWIKIGNDAQFDQQLKANAERLDESR
jgi:hypothetical protein